MDNLTTRRCAFTALMIFSIIGFNIRCSFATNVINQRERAVQRVVMSSALYCANYGDRAGLHHPWVCAIPPELGISNRRFIQQLKAKGFAFVDHSWILQIKRPKHFLYVEIEEVEWLTKRRIRVKIYLCMDLNTEVLAEASATLYLQHIKNKWDIDPTDSLIETGE